MSTEEIACLRDTGSELYIRGPSLGSSPLAAYGSEAKKRSARRHSVVTISSSPPSLNLKGLQRLSDSLEPDTGSRQDQKDLETMSGKTPPPSPEPGSKWEPHPCAGTMRAIGKKYFDLQRQEVLDSFPLTSKYVIIGNYKLTLGPSPQSLQTIIDRLESRKTLMFFMEPLELENLEGPGSKGLMKLTVKIHAPSGGMDTKVKSMLLSTNSEELLTLATYCDGLIVTHCVWSAKDPAYPWKPPRSGSLLTFLQINGILS